jgi:xylulokinase
MLPSLLWLKEKSPGLFRRIKCVLLPKDYIRYRLTGNLGWECSDGSSSLCFDTAKRRISEGILRTFDIPAAIFPPVHESIEIAGQLSPRIAGQVGLSSQSVVVMGAGDQQAQALGNGIIKYGLLSSTIGTGGQLFAPLASFQFDPQLRCHTFCHCLPRLWHAQTAILSAGLSLRWLRDRVFGEDYARLSARAASAPPGSKGLFFVPYLLGERTPHMDSSARAGFAGLSLQHDSADMIRAVFEGVVFAMRDGLEILRENGIRIQKIFASGGAVKSRLWLQLQADIYNSPIHLTATQEAASLGAAMLAGLGSGVYKDAEEAAGICVRVKDEVVLPNKADARIYEDRYQQFRKLSPFFVDFFHAQQA